MSGQIITIVQARSYVLLVFRIRQSCRSFHGSILGSLHGSHGSWKRSWKIPILPQKSRRENISCASVEASVEVQTPFVEAVAIPTETSSMTASVETYSTCTEATSLGVFFCFRGSSSNESISSVPEVRKCLSPCFIVAIFLQGAMQTANAWVICAAGGTPDAQVNFTGAYFLSLN